MIEIVLQDLFLRHYPFQLHGLNELPDLGSQAASPPRRDRRSPFGWLPLGYGETYELAGYGGGPGDDAPGGDVLGCGPQESQGVDAGMAVEPAVLDADGNQRQPI